MQSADAVRYVKRELAKGLSPQKVADGLVTLAVKRYTADNVAAVVIDLVGSKARQGKGGPAKAPGAKNSGWGL